MFTLFDLNNPILQSSAKQSEEKQNKKKSSYRHTEPSYITTVKELETA